MVQEQATVVVGSTTITIIRSTGCTPDNRKPTLTYNSRGWLKPMNHREFIKYLQDTGQTYSPKNPKFKRL